MMTLHGLGRGAPPGSTTFSAPGATSTVPVVRTPAVYIGSALYGGGTAPTKTVMTSRTPTFSTTVHSTIPLTTPVVTVPAPYAGTIAPSATTTQVSVTTSYVPLLLIGGAVVLVIILMSGGGK